jgi:hypothetical protein
MVIPVIPSVLAGGLTTVRPELLMPPRAFGLRAQIFGFAANFVGVPDQVLNFIPRRRFCVPSHLD